MYKKIILISLLVIGLGLLTNLFLNSKFKTGDCIKAEDGYIWHINSYKLTNYSLMGWLKNGWGNEVKMHKSVIERKNSSGVPVYHSIVCPEYNPN